MRMLKHSKEEKVSTDISQEKQTRYKDEAKAIDDELTAIVSDLSNKSDKQVAIQLCLWRDKIGTHFRVMKHGTEVKNG